jgi:hypothetical protein
MGVIERVPAAPIEFRSSNVASVSFAQRTVESVRSQLLVTPALDELLAWQRDRRRRMRV